MKNKKSKLYTSIRLTAFLLLISLIPLSSPILCQESAASSVIQSLQLPLQLQLSPIPNDSLDLKLIDQALLKAEYFMNENYLLKQQLTLCDSTIKTLQSLPVLIQKEIITEYKTNWLVTTLVTAAVLLANWSLYLLITNE